MEIMADVQEALALAKRQAHLPPVRIARILAGEGTGQFSSATTPKEKKRTVPLSVALEYVGTILDESGKESTRLEAEIEEYSQLCTSMEHEIDSLLRASFVLPPGDDKEPNRLNIEETYARVTSEETEARGVSALDREAFWRDMEQSDEHFETISRYFAKGVFG